MTVQHFESIVFDLDDEVNVTGLQRPQYNSEAYGYWRQLQNARQVIVDLLPAGVQAIVRPPYIERRSEWTDWLNRTVVALLELAEVRDAEEMGDADINSDRAYCPLCRGSRQSGFIPSEIQGFAYPIGLRRHLEGRTRGRRCPVLEEISELCFSQVSILD